MVSKVRQTCRTWLAEAFFGGGLRFRPSFCRLASTRRVAPLCGLVVWTSHQTGCITTSSVRLKKRVLLERPRHRSERLTSDRLLTTDALTVAGLLRSPVSERRSVCGALVGQRPQPSRGRRSVKVVPRSAEDCTSIDPPWASAICRAM